MNDAASNPNLIVEAKNQFDCVSYALGICDKTEYDLMSTAVQVVLGTT
jgi:hypothetical protein